MINENVYLYCCDDISLIENYDKALNDNTQTYICHHRLEIDLKMSHKELIKIDKYYNRPASELIFLTRQEHNSLHFSGENHYRYKKHCSEECKQKISQALTGRKLSEETKQKMRHTQTEETRRKISLSSTGKEVCEETRKKISQKLIGHKLSEETKEKIRLAAIKQWEKYHEKQNAKN